MKRTLMVLGIVAVFALAYGAFFLEPVEAGCGEGSGCGMSHLSQQQSTAPAAKAGKYTCPMHPEVVSDTPGKCPKCGMNLEKVQGSAVNQSEMTGDIAAQCQQMVEEFSALEDHFDMMMKLTDVEDLGPAMVEHQKMMTQFADHLASHKEVCQQAKSPSNPSRTSHTGHSGFDH
jgi:hypothetical protein